MQFSDTTNKNGLIQKVEFYANLGDGAVSGNSTLLKQVTQSINDWQNKIITMILASQDDWDFDDSSATDYPVATTPLVAGQRDYTFPTSLNLLKVKRIDVTYDGTNWYRAEMFDSGEIGLGMGNDANTDARYSKNKPAYDLKSNAIWLYPEASSADVSAGATVRVEFQRDVTQFASTDTTAKSSLPLAFQPMIAQGAAYEFCAANELPGRAQGLLLMLQDGEARLKQFYGRRDNDGFSALKAGYVNYE